MVDRRKVRDSALIDTLDDSKRIPFEGRVYRVIRDGRDPLRSSAPGGRWDDGTFEVLYTSREADGAIAEIYFHLMRGQPVFPSKVRFQLYEIHVEPLNAIKLDLTLLEKLGVTAENYGRLNYLRRQSEYARTQEISEVAHFLGADGLIVPSARWPCENVVLFSGHIPPDAITIISEPVDIESATWKRIATRTR